MKKLFLVALSTIVLQSLMAQKFSISGYVKDKATGEELIGATIYIEETKVGISSNVYGFYSVSAIQGNYTVTYSYIGYVSTKKQLSLTKNITLDVELEASTTELNEVVVSSEAANKNVTSTEMSTTKLDLREVKSLPVLFGEQDVLKTIQLTPGVKSAGEGNSGFYVRGGGSDQNLILLDEAPVYNASHVFGFLSVFNADALKDVKLYKGNMPADYGGRLSSVLDIKMKEGNMKEYHGNVSIGTLLSKIQVEGPIVENQSSFMVSARRTYFDFLFLRFSNDTMLQQSKMYFYDLNVKTNVKVNDKNRVFLSGYFGKDIMDLSGIFGNKYGNVTGTLRWNHLFNNKLFLNSTLIYSNYQYAINVDLSGMQMEMNSGIKDVNWKEDFQYFASSNSTITFGCNVINHTFNPGKMKSNYEAISDISIPNKHALENAVYVANDHKITERLMLNYGVRFSMFNVVGPYNSYSYRANGDLSDTVVYDDNALVESYYGFEPRVSGTFRLNEFSSLKSGYSRTRQNIHLLQNSTAGSPVDYWIPSTDKVKPEVCDQVSLGYFRNFSENMFETSVEVYYKVMENQVDYRSGTQVLLNEHVERDLLFGKGKSYGAEFQIRKKTGDLTGWVGYTLSKTVKHFDELNDGEWFNAKQDRTHDVSVVGVYQLSANWSLSGSWVYYTGDAVTWPTGMYAVNGQFVESYSARNSDRLPDYHRMDFGANWTKKKGMFKHVVNLSLFNVYAKKNPFMITFDQDKNNPRKKVAKAVYLFPIPIPAFSYTVEF